MTETQGQTRPSSSMTRRVAIISGGLAVLVIAIVGVTLLAGNNGSSGPKIAAVKITDQGFQPATLTVKSGTTITWTNGGVVMHQVASNPFPKDDGLPGLKSEILNNTQTYSFVANKTGTYGYHDQLNPTMNGTIVVEKK
ncbi:MAG TPA: cupredoxin domain-containing protein [Candidatus Saccharimonadales bacterium]|nr:cupredoxin domain-containing protein [Candidatus Saccharimonadales bacterium]